MVAFLGVCSILIYIKYYTEDHNTAVYHLGYVASGFSIAVYGSPLVSVVRIKMSSEVVDQSFFCLLTITRNNGG